MQSSRLPVAAQEILKDKVKHIEIKHAEVLEAIESLDEHVTKVKDHVCSMVSAENYTAKDALILAEGVDDLLDELTKYHQTILKLNYGLNGPRPADMLLDPVTKQHGHMCQTDVSANISNTDMEKHDTSLNILMVEMEVLKQQLSSLQNSHDTRLQELETKVRELKDDQNSAENNFNLRIQNVEAQNLLIQDAQLRNDTSSKHVENELSRLRKDVISVQDDINRLDVHQDVIGERIDDVKRKTDDLLRLRAILNDLHVNVTRREELIKKFNYLEEEVTTLNCIVNPLVTQIAENIPGHKDKKDPIPVFVAQATRHKVMPGDRICFPSWWQEWNCYDPHTSLFTAPVEGLYFFCVSLNLDSKGLLGVAVMRNKEALAHCASVEKDEQISTTVVLRLATGDCVWIKANEQTNPDGVYIGGGYSSFMGYYLK